MNTRKKRNTPQGRMKICVKPLREEMKVDTRSFNGRKSKKANEQYRLQPPKGF